MDRLKSEVKGALWSSSDDLHRLRPALDRVATPFVFWTTFAFAFLLSGIFSLVEFIPYQLGLVSALSIPLIAVTGIKLDRVTWGFLLIVLAVFSSALVNQSSPLDLALFMRIPIFSFVAFRLAQLGVVRVKVRRVASALFIVGLIQPIVLLGQRLTAEFLDRSGNLITWPYDAFYGTFNLKSDAPMSIFLLLLVIYLLFDGRSTLVGTRRFAAAFIFSLGVLMGNAELSKLVLVVLWGGFLFRNLNSKMMLVACIGLVLVSIVLAQSVGLEPLGSVWHAIRWNIDTRDMADFMTGGYARGTAIGFYLSQPIQWVGAGPGAFFDPISGSYSRGVQGQLLTFYGEVGAITLLLSYWILYLIQRQGQDLRRITLPQFLSFIVVLVHTVTIPVMNDLSVMFAYSIFGALYLQLRKDPIELTGHLDASERSVL